MGISTESIVKSLYDSISEIDEVLSLDENETLYRDDFAKLKELVKPLWPAYMNCVCRYGNIVPIGERDFSPFAYSIKKHIEDVTGRHLFDDDCYLEESYSIDHFLCESRSVSNFNRMVYKIYEKSMEVFTIFIAYKDDFDTFPFKGMQELFGNILGFCYNWFKKSSEYATAYLCNRICAVLAGKRDSVYKYIKENHLYHDFNKFCRLDIEILLALHKQLNECEDSKTLDRLRLVTLARYIDSFVRYEDSHNGLLKFMSKNGFGKFKKEVMVALAENRKKKEEKDKISNDEYFVDNFNKRMALHGTHWWAPDKEVKENFHYPS